MPILMIGAGLAAYNHLRFGDIFEFGHLNLGTALFHLGRPAQAALHYQQAIDHGLDSPEVRKALALMRNGTPAAAGNSRP